MCTFSVMSYFMFNIDKSIWIKSFCTSEAFYYVASHSIATIIGFSVCVWLYIWPKSKYIYPKLTSPMTNVSFGLSKLINHVRWVVIVMMWPLKWSETNSVNVVARIREFKIIDSHWWQKLNFGLWKLAAVGFYTHTKRHKAEPNNDNNFHCSVFGVCCMLYGKSEHIIRCNRAHIHLNAYKSH